jgi:hypothetical protein
MREYDFCVGVCIKKLGRPMFTIDRLAWISRLINNTLIRIGRFKYELPCKRVSGIRVYKSKEGRLAVLADGLQIHSSGRVLGSAGLNDTDGSFYAAVKESESEIVGYPVIDGFVKGDTVTLKKCEWKLCLSPEHDIIPVHIPPDESFDREACESSYARAREIFDTCFADKPYAAFHCRTWLLSLDLKKVLKPTSNILDFQKKYTLYPILSEGISIFDNVFPGQGGLANLKDLSEDTSLQRNVKRLYLDGGYVYDYSGFFF